MIDVDAAARECAEKIEKWIPYEEMRPSQIEKLKARFATIIAAALRARDAEWQGKLDRETRLLREQIRVGDVAFQHLHATSKGNPLPDWVKDGLPNMYALTAKLAEAEAQAAVRDNAFRELLQYLHTINDDRAVGFSAPMPVEVLEKAQVVLASLLSAV